MQPLNGSTPSSTPLTSAPSRRSSNKTQTGDRPIARKKPNTNTISDADEPMYDISPHYEDRSAVSKLPVIWAELTPEPAAADDEDDDKTLEYIRARPVQPAGGKYIPALPAQPAEWRVKAPAPLSFDELCMRAYALGERVALMTTKSDAGLINVTFWEDEYSSDSDGITPPQYMLLALFLAGMASLIGYSAALKVLHLDVIGMLIEGAMDCYRRRARHDAGAAAKYAEIVDQLKAAVMQGAEVVLATDAKDFDGDARELEALKATAAQILVG